VFRAPSPAVLMAMLVTGLIAAASTRDAAAPDATLLDDAVTHHVYSSKKGLEFNLETLSPGKSASYTFSKKGRVDVRCGLHPGMRLVVTVE
jgi:hypothetical protein